MAIENNWQLMIKPDSLNMVEGKRPGKEATVVLEPLERGFGVTLGNSLRRVMMSSLQGAAISAVQIEGVVHEFSTIPGVREDVTTIVLNLKEVAIKCDAVEPVKMTLRKTGPGPVTAGDIQTVGDATILNPEFVICNLDNDAEVSFELVVETGKGYRPSQRESADNMIGYIPIDCLFSPVTSVSYTTENTRSGRVLTYDKLTMDVATDGSISPLDALAFAARIIQEQLSIFVNFDEPQVRAQETLPELPFNPALLKRIDELELSVRSANCLRNDNLMYIGDLIKRTEADMLRTPNFGRKSLNEIKEVLARMGLHFGMEVEEWPPENIREMARKYEEHY